MINITKQLKLCVDEREVWELMKDEKLHPKHKQLFCDSQIILPNAHQILSVANLPNNSFGLMARIVSYLKFRGYLGHVNFGSGPLQYIRKFQTIWNDMLKLNLLFDGDEVNDITTNMIDNWLKDQLKNASSRGILGKIVQLKDWQSCHELLPFFLTNNAIRQYNFPSFNDLEEHINETNPNYKNKETYPRHLMWPIIQEAIIYIEKYTDDIILLMENKARLGDPTVHHSSREQRTIYFFRDVQHTFQEPRLKELQQVCRSYKSTSHSLWKKKVRLLFEDWKKDDRELLITQYGILNTVIFAVRRWLASNAIILALFNGGRSQEIILQPRNIKTPKTRYHELDKGMNFTRIVWKTERNGKLLTNPMPLIGIQAYRNLCSYSELFDGQKTGTLILEDYNKSAKRTTNRMFWICKNFSIWVHGKDTLELTPHELRHAIASIVTHLDKHNGLMLAAKLLGHRSASMTITYEAQLKNFIVEQIQYMSETSEEFKDSMREYQAADSLKVFNEEIAPRVKNGESFYGPAKNFVDFSGNIIKDKQSWFEVTEEALTSGEYGIIDCGTHICIHSLKSTHQMSCQRGFNLTDYKGVPLAPSACVGSICTNSFFTEDHAKAAEINFKSVRELAPLELQEIAKEWFIAYADNLTSPNQKIYEEYKADQERKYKEYNKEAING